MPSDYIDLPSWVLCAWLTGISLKSKVLLSLSRAFLFQTSCFTTSSSFNKWHQYSPRHAAMTSKPKASLTPSFLQSTVNQSAICASKFKDIQKLDHYLSLVYVSPIESHFLLLSILFIHFSLYQPGAWPLSIWVCFFMSLKAHIISVQHNEFWQMYTRRIYHPKW